MSMRQDAIEIMKAHPGKPTEVVIPLIATKIERSIPFARRMYHWIVEHGMAPGDLRTGRIAFSLRRSAPRDYTDALKQLREHLLSPTSDPEDVDQLMRDCSNFDAIGSLANGRTITSMTLKQYNRCVSERAHRYMTECSSFEQWDKATTNEHSTPVGVMRLWITERLHSITDEEIRVYFCDNPVCTILIDPEDNLLRSLGYHTRGTKDIRYTAAGIKMVRLANEPVLWQRR